MANAMVKTRCAELTDLVTDRKIYWNANCYNIKACDLIFTLKNFDPVSIFKTESDCKMEIMDIVIGNSLCKPRVELCSKSANWNLDFIRFYY